jgi:hypothetical protein
LEHAPENFQKLASGLFAGQSAAFKSKKEARALKAMKHLADLKVVKVDQHPALWFAAI